MVLTGMILNAVIAKIREELDELETEISLKNEPDMKGELGDVLFALANLARHLKIDPDSALRDTNNKFRKRFNYIEENIENNGNTLLNASLDEMDALWNEAKTKS